MNIVAFNETSFSMYFLVIQITVSAKHNKNAMVPEIFQRDIASAHSSMLIFTGQFTPAALLPLFTNSFNFRPRRLAFLLP